MRWRSPPPLTACRIAARRFQLSGAGQLWPQAGGARPRRGRHGGGLAGRARRRAGRKAPTTRPSSTPCRFRSGCATRAWPWPGAIMPSCKGAGARDLDSAAPRTAALDRGERDLAAEARSQNAVQETRRFSVVNGQRRRAGLYRDPAGRCRGDRHRRGCDGGGGGGSAAAAACRCPCRHPGHAANGGGDLRPRPEADFLQQGLCAPVGPVGAVAGQASQSTAKSSTGCARTAGCPNSATIRPGSGRAWRFTRMGCASARDEETGICRTARPSRWSPSRIRPAA